MKRQKIVKFMNKREKLFVTLHKPNYYIMRKLFYLSLIVSITIGINTSCERHTKQNFTISLDITKGDSNIIFLSKREGGEMINYDSVQLINGIGIITGTVDLPEFYYLRVKDTRTYFPLFVEAGDIVVMANIDDPKNAIVSGSLSQDSFEAYNDSVSEFNKQTSLLSNQYGEAHKISDTARMKEIEEEYDIIDDQKTEYLIKYAVTNNNNVVSAFLALSNSYKLSLEDLDKIVGSFNQSIDSSTYVKKLKQHLGILKATAVGQPFVDFALNSPEGTPIPLSSITNDNYVLVDFWASWCAPCRVENPNVVLAYNKFHDKGFDIVGVSFDKDHDKWVEAIEEDSLTWTHVSDLKYWNSAAGKLYAIKSIPQNILIDPDGIIIEKNLRGQELQNKLEELLGPVEN